MDTRLVPGFPENPLDRATAMEHLSIAGEEPILGTVSLPVEAEQIEIGGGEDRIPSKRPLPWRTWICILAESMSVKHRRQASPTRKPAA